MCASRTSFGPSSATSAPTASTLVTSARCVFDRFHSHHTKNTHASARTHPSRAITSSSTTSVAPVVRQHSADEVALLHLSLPAIRPFTHPLYQPTQPQPTTRPHLTTNILSTVVRRLLLLRAGRLERRVLRMSSALLSHVRVAVLSDVFFLFFFRASCGSSPAVCSASGG